MRLKIVKHGNLFYLRHNKSGLFYNGNVDKSHIMQKIMNDYLETWGYGQPTEAQSLRHFVTFEEAINSGKETVQS